MNIIELIKKHDPVFLRRNAWPVGKYLRSVHGNEKVALVDLMSEDWEVFDRSTIIRKRKIKKLSPQKENKLINFIQRGGLEEDLKKAVNVPKYVFYEYKNKYKNNLI